MTDLKPPELFSQRPAHMEFVQEQFSRTEVARMRSYRIRRVITCTVLVALIGGGIYEIVEWNSKPTEIPTIEAEGSLKQKPEQPGGLDVPNQDVLAYQQLDNSGAKPATEHLLPPPEVPQTATVPATGKTPATGTKVENFEAPAVDALAPASVTPQIATAPQVSPTPLPSVTMPAKTQVVEVPSPAATPAPQDKDNEDAAPAKSDKNAAKSAGGKKNVRIQLASFPEEEEASRQLGRMQAKYGEELGDAKLHLAKADLGSRGIFYRVQSNPISDSDARDICAALKKLKAGCIIVKP